MEQTVIVVLGFTVVTALYLRTLLQVIAWKMDKTPPFPVSRKKKDAPAAKDETIDYSDQAILDAIEPLSKPGDVW